MKDFIGKVLRLALCACVCMAAGCSKDVTPDDNGGDGNDFYLTLDPADGISVPAEGGSVTVAVNSSVTDWTVSLDSDWCAVERGDSQFIISASSNETGESRSATAIVEAYRQNRNIHIEYSVTQDSLEDNGDGSDLSAGGQANCYLVDAAGDYRFDATVRGNGATTEGLGAPGSLAGSQAKLVWQSSKDLVGNVSLEDGCVSFTITGCGNALIALCDGDGNILWSWHIWYPETEPAALHSKTGYDVMDMNLGAMNCNVADAGSYGLLYQWGRKDPFPAAATLTGDEYTVGATLYDGDGNEVSITNSSWYSTTDNTIAYSIANPTVCLSNYWQYVTGVSRDWLEDSQSNDALWGNPLGDRKDENKGYSNSGAKSFYDPCPVGWRVPPADVFRTFTSSGGYESTLDGFDVADLDGDGEITSADFNCGWIFNLDEGVTSWFPAAARYDGSYAMLMGSVSGLWGSYWGNAPYTDSTAGMGFSVLSFQASSVSPAAGGSRADAYSVRCVRE